MAHGTHHLHKRESNFEEQAKKSKGIRVLDKICLVFSVLMPATAIPQIYVTYATQDATGVSLLMWVLYFIAVIPWVIYGFVHKSKPLVVLNVLWLIVQVTMIIGILLYT